MEKINVFPYSHSPIQDHEYPLYLGAVSNLPPLHRRMIPARREQYKNLMSLPSPELLNRLADEARKKKKKRKRDEFSDAETGDLLESLAFHRFMLMNIPPEPNKTRKTTPAPQNSQPHMPPPVKVTKYPSSILNQLSKVMCKLR